MSGTRTGGCLCGAIRVEADGQPLGRVECHCAQCRKIAGGGPALLVQFRDADFRVTKGAPQAHETFADSGAAVIRYFCTDCGTPICSRPTRFEGIVVLKAGVFDSAEEFAPDAVIWTSEAAPDALFSPGAPTYPKGSS